MAVLDAKLDAEARPGTIVVCFRFPMKTRKPVWQEAELYLYEVD